MRGLLDFLQSEDAQLGLALLAAGGPQARPMGFGERMSMALGYRDQFRDSAEKKRLQEEDRQLRMEDRQWQQQQRERAKTQWGREDAKAALDQEIAALAPQFFKPGSPALAPLMGSALTGQDDGIVPSAGRTATPASFDMQGYVGALMSKDSTRALPMWLEMNKPRTPINVAPGGTLIDPTTFKPVFTAPDKPAEQPSDVRQYEFARGQGYTGSFLDYQRELKRAGASNVQVQYGAPVAGQDAQGNPIFFQPSKDGGRPAIIPGVAPPKTDKPLTEAQAKAQTFFGQMTAAENFYRENDIDTASLPSQVGVAAAGGRFNIAVPAQAQKAKQAQDQWSEAYLRFKTGAAATKDEVELNNRTFFPKVGDSSEVIEQKRLARESAMRDIKAAATGKPGEVPPLKPLKRPVAEGMYNGRKVIKYDDGSVEYAK